MKRVVDERQLPLRVWMMLREDRSTGSPPTCRDTASSTTATSGSRCARPSVQIDGALGSRGAWMLEPYADLPSTSGLNTDSLDDISRSAELAMQVRLSDGGPRHRRPRQPRDAEHLRERVRSASRKAGKRAALAHRARAAPQRGRHPAVRPARRHRLDAGDPLHVGRAVRPRAPRSEARRGRRLRLAEADEVGRDHRQRHRRAGRGHRSDPVLLRIRVAPAEGRQQSSSPISA